ncbi:MAG: DUF6624 domain-containing protein [Pirellulaceae bacterium]
MPKSNETEVEQVAQIQAEVDLGTDPELAAELKRRVEVDQKARMELIESMKGGKPISPELSESLTKIDEENTTWLSEIVDDQGWPGKTLVGTKGAHDAWLLVQHADRSPEFQKKCLELMVQAEDGEIAKTDIAYLTDRVLVAEGQPQRFGTQCEFVDGKAQVKLVEDPDNLDQRRKEYGLGPIAEYLKQIETVYSQSSDK